MLVAALVMFLVAAVIFLISFARSNWQSFIDLGLGIISGGLAFLALYLLENEDKL